MRTAAGSAVTCSLNKNFCVLVIFRHLRISTTKGHDELYRRYQQSFATHQDESNWTLDQVFCASSSAQYSTYGAKNPERVCCSFSCLLLVAPGSRNINSLCTALIVFVKYYNVGRFTPGVLELWGFKFNKRYVMCDFLAAKENCCSCRIHRRVWTAIVCGGTRGFSKLLCCNGSEVRYSVSSSSQCKSQHCRHIWRKRIMFL